MKTCVLLSPAKINLTLQVLKKRKDGYHEVYTIFQKISLYDEIEVKLKPSGFDIKCFSDEEIPLKENLVFKAYNLLKTHFKVKEGFEVKIKKNIPIGAGLGGGSSNAGYFLKAISSLLNISVEDLFPIAKNIGADVPFFLSDKSSAIGRGIGDILLDYPCFKATYLIVYPGFKISTSWAYKNLSLHKEKEPIYYSSNIPPWRQSYGLINDFRDLIFKTYPIFFELEKWLKEQGAIAVQLSGTGSCLFGVFEKISPKFFNENLKIFEKNVKIFVAESLWKG